MEREGYVIITSKWLYGKLRDGKGYIENSVSIIIE